MSVFQTSFATGRQIAPYDDSGNLTGVRVDFQVSNAMVDSTGTVRANFTANDVIEFLDVPPGHVPDDCVLVSDDIDSNGTPTVVMSVGIINAANNAIDTAAANGGAAWIASSNIGQAGGMARPTTAAIFRCTPQESSARRRVGIHIATAPATLQAGVISLIFRSRSAHYGA